MKLYPQFHPSKAFDVLAVVLAKRKTPVKTKIQHVDFVSYGILPLGGIGRDVLVDRERVPLRPK